MPQKYHLIVLILAFTILVGGCKKQDIIVSVPDVEMIAPYNDQLFSTFDTVFIKGEIKHSRTILKINLSIVNEQLQPIVSGKVIEVGSNEYYLNTYLVIDNKYIGNSRNFLLIKIEDNVEIHKNWVEISIIGLDRQLKNILVVTGTSNNNKLISLYPNSTVNTLFSWTSDYLGGYADSHNSMFYTCGKQLDGIRGWELIDNQLKWYISLIPNSSLPYFTAFDSQNGIVIAATNEGYIKGYNTDGLNVFKSDQLSNGKYTGILKSDKFLIAVFKPYSGNMKSIIVFNFPAGNIFRQTQLKGEVIDMIGKDDNQILMIVEDQGINKAMIYDIESNSLNILHTLPSEPITTVEMSNDYIFMATAGSIFWNKPDYGSVVEYIQKQNVVSMAFDNISNQLFAGVNDSIFVYKLPGTTAVESFFAGDKIKDIQLFYNK